MATGGDQYSVHNGPFKQETDLVHASAHVATVVTLRSLPIGIHDILTESFNQFSKYSRITLNQTPLLGHVLWLSHWLLSLLLHCQIDCGF